MQVSMVVPVYRSAACLSELAQRVRDQVGLYFRSYELILVNDCSPDESWEVIVRLVNNHDFITGVNLRKNVGQDNAIMAGLSISTGEVVVIMDDDLQHDPREIASLCEQIQMGFDVAFAKFDNKHHAAWKNLGSRFNDWCATLLLGKPRGVYMSPFKALSRGVVDEITKYKGPYPYVDGLIFTITARATQVLATHHQRFAGRSNYNLLRSIAVWLKLATGFSVVPLRAVTLLGGVISVLSFLLGSYFAAEALWLQHEPPGWPSVIVAIFFIGGIQLIALGAIGEYIGRMFITQNDRPQFTIGEICRPAEQRKSVVAAATGSTRMKSA